MAPLEWSDLWDAMRKNPDEWQPTTAEMYEEMLNVLPPIRWVGRRFLVGEPNHHNAQDEAVYACFKRWGNNYSAKYQTIREFEAD